ncbi:hypothetical protein M3J09_005072 [Ascochyta lentis]
MAKLMAIAVKNAIVKHLEQTCMCFLKKASNVSVGSPARSNSLRFEATDGV